MAHENTEGNGQKEAHQIAGFKPGTALWAGDWKRKWWHRASPEDSEQASWLLVLYSALSPAGFGGGDIRLKLTGLVKSSQTLKHPRILMLKGLRHNDDWTRSALEHEDPGPEFRPLSEWLKENGNPMPFGQALSLWSQILEAVDCAHRSHPPIVHGDLRPETVFVDAEGRNVKVGCFQVSRLLNQHVFRVPGSPLIDIVPYLAYKSPEELADLKADPTPESDIFALGLLLFRLLTGRLPLTPSVEDEKVSVENWRTLSPSGRSPRESLIRWGQQHAADIPHLWDKAIARMLHQKGSKRPRTSDLLKLIRDDQALDPPKSGLGSFLLKAAAGLVGVLCLVGVVIAFKPDADSDDPPHGLPPETPQPFVNSLGLAFVPVPGTSVLFSTTETRVVDFAAFVSEHPEMGHAWKEVEYKGVHQSPDHPVVNVTWDNAVSFCDWLTTTELKSGKIPPGSRYRLPTDHEWSCAAELGDRENPNESPLEKNGRFPERFPWGVQFPPPEGAGNYCGMESDRPKRIEGYRDAYPFTAPVGSFRKSRLGLYDLGGNVWEFCQDHISVDQTPHVLRGGSWDEGDAIMLAASAREYYSPDRPNRSHGFRCVLEWATDGHPKPD